MVTDTNYLPETQDETQPDDLNGMVDDAMNGQQSQEQPAPETAAGEGGAIVAPPAPQPISQEQYAALAQQNAQLQAALQEQAMLAQAQQTLAQEQQTPQIESVEDYAKRLDEILPLQYSDPDELNRAREALIARHAEKVQMADAQATRQDIQAMREELAQMRQAQQSGGGWDPNTQFAALNMAATMAGMVGDTFDPTYVFQGLQSGQLDPVTHQMVTDIMQGVTVQDNIQTAQPKIRANILRRAQGGQQPNGAVAQPQTNGVMNGGMPPTPQGGGTAGATGRRFNSLEEVTDEFLRDGTTMTPQEFDQHMAEFT